MPPDDRAGAAASLDRAGTRIPGFTPEGYFKQWTTHSCSRAGDRDSVERCFVGEPGAFRFGSRRRAECDTWDRVGELTQRQTGRPGLSPNEFFGELSGS